MIRKEIKILIFFIVLTSLSYGQEISTFSFPVDSSFSLKIETIKERQQFLKYWEGGSHCCVFQNQIGQNIDSLNITNSFNKLESYAKLDLSIFKVSYIKENNHNIKIWVPKTKGDSIIKITEINSYYKLDTFLLTSILESTNDIETIVIDTVSFTDTIKVYSCIILTNKTPHIITFQTGYNPSYDDNKPIYCIDKKCVFKFCEVMGLFRNFIDEKFFQRIDQLVEEGKKRQH